MSASSASVKNQIRSLFRQLHEVDRAELADDLAQRYIDSCAENVIIEIQRLNEREREKLASLLARLDLLPGYTTVRKRGLAAEDDYGLAGKAQQLVAFLRYGEAKHRNEIINELWPSDAAKSKDLDDDWTLRNRLRKLVSDTNRQLRLIDCAPEIRRGNEKKRDSFFLAKKNPKNFRGL